MSDSLRDFLKAHFAIFSLKPSKASDQVSKTAAMPVILGNSPSSVRVPSLIFLSGNARFWYWFFSDSRPISYPIIQFEKVRYIAVIALGVFPARASSPHLCTDLSIYNLSIFPKIIKYNSLAAVGFFQFYQEEVAQRNKKLKVIIAYFSVGINCFRIHFFRPFLGYQSNRRK